MRKIKTIEQYKRRFLKEIDDTFQNSIKKLNFVSFPKNRLLVQELLYMDYIMHITSKNWEKMFLLSLIVLK